MFEILLELIQGEVDFQNVFFYVGIYLGSLWLLFSLWVFFDARKRYHNFFAAIGLFIAVLILNFPALIFYLIIRPEEELEAGGIASNGAMIVPIANFVDDSGDVQFSVNIDINRALINNSDNKITFSFAGMPEEQQQADTQVKKENKIGSYFQNLTKKISTNISGLKGYIQKFENEDKEEIPVKSEPLEAIKKEEVKEN